MPLAVGQEEIVFMEDFKKYDFPAYTSKRT